MDLDTKENGALRRTRNMVTEYKFGVTDQCIRVIGKMIKQTVGEG